MADVEINLEITNPQELLGLGLRAYAIGDFYNAAAAFSRASQLIAQEHGDEHDSLGEVHLNYAKALLELSREEAEPLGDAIPHGDSDSDSDEPEGENGVSSSTDNKDDTADKPAEEPQDEKPQNGESTEPDGDEEKPNEDSDAPQKADECSDLQVAWEVLEVAKKIFTKRGDAGKTLLAETLILLGEVAMESENFTDGVNDMRAGLELQKDIYEPTSRKLAESYYKLGMALATISNIEEAIASFDMSIETLRRRIKMLEETMQEKPDKAEETKTDEEAGDEKKEEKSRTIKRTKTEDEIKEMQALIPEIQEKISDTRSIKEEMAAKLMLEMTNCTPKKDVPSSSKAASDISHLVKRKRKDDEEVAEAGDANPPKKPSP